MGSDKAFLEFRGETLLQRAMAVLRSAAGTVTVVGDPTRFPREVAAVADTYPGCGPLGGIHAALAHSACELNLVMAVDLPLVTAELLVFLREAARSSSAMAVVPRTARGYQPLCAVYRRHFGTLAEKALRAGRYKVDAVFAEEAVRIVGEEELAAAGFSERLFFNVNTPDDLRAAESGESGQPASFS